MDIKLNDWKLEDSRLTLQSDGTVTLIQHYSPPTLKAKDVPSDGLEGHPFFSDTRPKLKSWTGAKAKAVTKPKPALHTVGPEPDWDSFANPTDKVNAALKWYDGNPRGITALRRKANSILSKEDLQVASVENSKGVLKSAIPLSTLEIFELVKSKGLYTIGSPFLRPLLREAAQDRNSGITEVIGTWRGQETYKFILTLEEED